MEVEVPRNPEAAPATAMLAVVRLGDQPRLDKVMAKMTAQPMNRESPRWEREAIAHAPSREPGIRAMEETATMSQDTAERDLSIVVVEMTKASRRISVGTSSGLISAKIGVAMVPRPNPMVPWQIVPTRISTPMKI